MDAQILVNLNPNLTAQSKFKLEKRIVSQFVEMDSKLILSSVTMEI